MKYRWLCRIGLMLLVMVTFGASLAKAATKPSPSTGNAFPSWDQQLQCDTTATCPRFTVLSSWGNAAVLDRETGLVWEQSPSTGTFNWASAQFHCNVLSVGNRKGWRLPVLQDLASLIDPSVASPGPTLPSGHPFSNVRSSFYWSATTNADNSSIAWVVLFSDGGVVNDDKSNNYFVWCVRGGQGVDPQ